MKRWLAIAALFYALDQVTKILVLRDIALHDVVPVIPGFFNLTYVQNTGAAFGLGGGNNWFFVILASVAVIALLVFSARGAFKDLPSKWAATLLGAGVLGNLTDRIWHGFVVDFLDFILPWYGHWPSFNVADSCICVAAGLFVIASFRGEKKA